MRGNEKFLFKNENLDFDFSDFWRFQYSNIYSLHGEIAEFIVARALEVTEAQNSAYWTLWDITYRNVKIEVKATAYYHLWNDEAKISKQRTFGITKANGAYDSGVCGNNDFCRETKETSYPLNLNNWEFYIVPTSFINDHCQDNKTISLGRIKSFGFEAKKYDQIKSEIDSIIDSGAIK